MSKRKLKRGYKQLNRRNRNETTIYWRLTHKPTVHSVYTKYTLYIKFSLVYAEDYTVIVFGCTIVEKKAKKEALLCTRILNRDIMHILKLLEMASMSSEQVFPLKSPFAVFNVKSN